MIRSHMLLNIVCRVCLSGLYHLGLMMSSLESSVRLMLHTAVCVIHLLLLLFLSVHWGLFSVPAFHSEWYWHNLMTGDAATVLFHNKVYGCSGVMPEKFPCTGPLFKWVFLIAPIVDWMDNWCVLVLCRYADFAPMFKAELFDPDHWASVFKAAGAKCKSTVYVSVHPYLSFCY